MGYFDQFLTIQKVVKIEIFEKHASEWNFALNFDNFWVSVSGSHTKMYAFLGEILMLFFLDILAKSDETENFEEHASDWNFDDF